MFLVYCVHYTLFCFVYSISIVFLPTFCEGRWEINSRKGKAPNNRILKKQHSNVIGNLAAESGDAFLTQEQQQQQHEHGSKLSVEHAIDEEVGDDGDDKDRDDGESLDQPEWLHRMWKQVESTIIYPAITAVARREKLQKQQLLYNQQLRGHANSIGQADFTIAPNSTASSSTHNLHPIQQHQSQPQSQPQHQHQPQQQKSDHEEKGDVHPGADTQHWHRDSGLFTHDISHYSVYISTTNVTPIMGPTQFLPGTHKDFHFKFDDWAAFFDHCSGALRTPLLTEGSMLIWEYRTIHRGTRNINSPESSIRPMLYKTYHLDGSWCDINMGNVSFYDLANR